MFFVNSAFHSSWEVSWFEREVMILEWILERWVWNLEEGGTILEWIVERRFWNLEECLAMAL